jgi:hypothetical protein
MLEVSTTALTGLKQFGLGTVLAVTLVWWITQSIDSKLDTHIDEQRLNLLLIRQICLNTATTEAQRSGCEFRIGGQ